MSETDETIDQHIVNTEKYRSKISDLNTRDVELYERLLRLRGDILVQQALTRQSRGATMAG